MRKCSVFFFLFCGTIPGPSPPPNERRNYVNIEAQATIICIADAATPNQSESWRKKNCKNSFCIFGLGQIYQPIPPKKTKRLIRQHYREGKNSNWDAFLFCTTSINSSGWRHPVKLVSIKVPFGSRLCPPPQPSPSAIHFVQWEC